MTAFHFVAHLWPCQWVNGLVSVSKRGRVDDLLELVNSETLSNLSIISIQDPSRVWYLRLQLQVLELLLSVNYWTLCHVCPNRKRKEGIETVHRKTSSSDHAWIKGLQIQLKPAEFNECLLELNNRTIRDFSSSFENSDETKWPNSRFNEACEQI